jgi:hypothetical protein
MIGHTVDISAEFYHIDEELVQDDDILKSMVRLECWA